jgi:hypothetical protein
MEDEVAVDVSPDLLQRAEGVIDLEVLLLVPRGCHPQQQRVEVPIIEASGSPQQQQHRAPPTDTRT